MTTNLNHPSLMPNRPISADEFDAIQRAHNGDVDDMLQRVAYMVREQRQTDCVCWQGQQGRKPCSTPAACGLCEQDDQEHESQFGALEGLTKGMPYVALAWVVVAALALVGWLVWRA